MISANAVVSPVPRGDDRDSSYSLTQLLIVPGGRWRGQGQTDFVFILLCERPKPTRESVRAD